MDSESVPYAAGLTQVSTNEDGKETMMLMNGEGDVHAQIIIRQSESGGAVTKSYEIVGTRHVTVTEEQAKVIDKFFKYHLKFVSFPKALQTAE